MINNKYHNVNIIIGGDYNSRIADKGNIDSKQLSLTGFFTRKRSSSDTEINQRGRDLLDFLSRNEMYIVNGRFPSDSPAQYTFVNTQGKSVIDLVMCNATALYNILDLQVMNSLTMSNHFPVKLNLNLNVRKVEKIKVIKWKDSNCTDFVSSMYYSNKVSNVSLDIDEMCSNLIDTISSVATNTNMTSTINNGINKKSKKWYDTECKKFKQSLEMKLEEVKRDNFPKNKVQEWHKLRNEYFRILQWKRDTFSENLAAFLVETRDSKEFWELLNSYRNFKILDSNVIDLRVWSEYFGKIYLENENNKELNLIRNNTDQILDAEITLEEVKIALKTCKLKKAPGSDGISNEFLKNLPDNWVLYIVILFNKIFKEQKVPESWTNIITKMIYKKGDKNNPENYRPISLVNTITKIFTLILYKRIYRWAEKNKKIPEWQAGFREGRSTLDHIFVLNAAIQLQLKRKGGKLYALFVDLKRAFDSVPHQILWQKLDSLGLSSQIIRVLKDLYDKASMVVKSSEGMSEKCNITQGLLQGEILSPILFALYISDIEEFLLSKNVRGISLNHLREAIMLAFADDKVFLADSYIMMKHIINHLQEYLNLNKLEVNICKTKIIIFQKGGHGHKKLTPLKYQGKEINLKKNMCTWV